MPRTYSKWIKNRQAECLMIHISIKLRGKGFSLIMKQRPVVIQSVPTLTILNANFQNGTVTSLGLLKLRDDNLLLTESYGKVRWKKDNE